MPFIVDIHIELFLIPFPPVSPPQNPRQKLADDLKEYRKTRPLSPCIDQTEQEIAAYYQNAPIGAQAAVRCTQGNVLQYLIMEIEGRKRGRVYVPNKGAFYVKSGCNCFQPKGQTRLVVPTEAVVAWAAEHPRCGFGIATYRERGILPV